MDFRPSQPCVCILASQRNGTLYIGVTSDIGHRTAEHKRLKDWRRAWMLRLIEELTPEWDGLLDEATGELKDGTAGEAGFRAGKSGTDG